MEGCSPGVRWWCAAGFGLPRGKTAGNPGARGRVPRQHGPGAGAGQCGPDGGSSPLPARGRVTGCGNSGHLGSSRAARCGSRGSEQRVFFWFTRGKGRVARQGRGLSPAGGVRGSERPSAGSGLGRLGRATAGGGAAGAGFLVYRRGKASGRCWRGERRQERRVGGGTFRLANSPTCRFVGKLAGRSGVCWCSGGGMQEAEREHPRQRSGLAQANRCLERWRPVSRPSQGRAGQISRRPGGNRRVAGSRPAPGQ